MINIKLIGNLKFTQKRFKKDIAPSKLIKFLSKKLKKLGWNIKVNFDNGLQELVNL